MRTRPGWAGHGVKACEQLLLDSNLLLTNDNILLSMTRYFEVHSVLDMSS